MAIKVIPCVDCDTKNKVYLDEGFVCYFCGYYNTEAEWRARHDDRPHQSTESN